MTQPIVTLPFSKTLRPHQAQTKQPTMGLPDAVADTFTRTQAKRHVRFGGDPYPQYMANSETKGVQDIDFKPYKTIQLFNTGIQNLDPLANAQDLQSLLTWEPNIAKLDPLANLVQLERLYLCDSPKITDLTPLAKLTQLKQLGIASSSVQDLTPLKNLTELEELTLNKVPFTSRSLQSLAEPLTQLTSLRLRETPMRASDFDVLKGFHQLAFLDLSHTEIQDVKPLLGLKNLKTLYLVDTNIKDVAQLAALPNLTTLVISNDNAQLVGLDALKKALPNVDVQVPSQPTYGKNTKLWMPTIRT